MTVAPVDRLLVIMRESDMAASRAFLRYALARRVVTPEWIFNATGRDEAYELACAVESEGRDAWEREKAENAFRRGRRLRGELE